MQLKALVNEFTLFKYLWIIVMLPKELQMISFFVISISLILKSKIKFDLISIMIIMYSITHFFAIYISSTFGDYDITRILAAINTALIWIIAIIMYIYYKNKKIDITVLSKYCYRNMLILIILSLVSLILYNLFGMRSFTLFHNTLYAVDWFNNNPQLRFVAFFEYSNLVILFYMLNFPYYYIYINENKKGLSKYILLLLSFIPVLITLSRSGYAVILLVTLIGISKTLIKKIDLRLLLFYLFMSLSIIILIMIFYDVFPKILEFIFTIINGREGSTSTRTYLYSESIRLTNQISPLWGIGIKVISKTGYPLGSHSTYIGFYYKAGIIGAIFASIAFINIIYKLLKIKFLQYKFNIAKLYIILFPLLLIFEDLDGANWLVVSYFCILGILFNTNNFEYLHKERIEES